MVCLCVVVLMVVVMVFGGWRGGGREWKEVDNVEGGIGSLKRGVV